MAEGAPWLAGAAGSLRLSTAPLSSFSARTNPVAVAFPPARACIARSSSLPQRIIAGQQQSQCEERRIDGASISQGSNLLDNVQMPAASVWHRRTVCGLGAIISTTGLGMFFTHPESIAATAGCSDLTTVPSGIAYCDIALGSGIEASKGLLIKAHYAGRLENGSPFDSSYKRGKPFVFRLGVGEVIKGWDQGILGTTDGIPPMLAGGKRTLRIPPQFAYGERGAGCRAGSCLIPPQAVLIFDVEFLGKA